MHGHGSRPTGHPHQRGLPERGEHADAARGFAKRGFDPDTAVAELGKTVPLGRIAEPEDIADVVLFLVSEEAWLHVRLAGRGQWREAGGMTRFVARSRWSRAGEAGSVTPLPGVCAEGARVFTAQRGADTEFEGIAADFADPDSPEQAVAQVIDRAGRLDVLVNNAGIMQEARVEEMSLADWERNLAVNLTAPFLLIRAALPHLRASRGSIVNIGSIEGLGSNPGHAAYQPPWPGCTG